MAKWMGTEYVFFYNAQQHDKYKIPSLNFTTLYRTVLGAAKFSNGRIRWCLRKGINTKYIKMKSQSHPKYTVYSIY